MSCLDTPPGVFDIDDIFVEVLNGLSLSKIRQLKCVNHLWCRACRRTLTSTKWLVKGKTDDEVRSLQVRDTEFEIGPHGYSLSPDHSDAWSRVSQFASMIYHHTFTLPFHVMTWPGGVCFADDFGGLECRVGTLHSLVIEDGRVVRILLETKYGMFSTLRDVFDHVICRSPFMEYELEFDRDPDEFILHNLLPCIQVGKAYVSTYGAVCLMHAVNPFWEGPDKADAARTTIRTKFLL